MSNQTEVIRFPSPIGGTPFPADFAPSIVFAALYGLLAPLVFYRVLHRRSRTTLLIGTFTFSIERIVIFALRAVQSRNVQRRLSKGLLKYMQLSFGQGYIGIANDLVNLLRCLLVNPTYGPERYPESSAAATKECYMPKPEEGDLDYPKQRFWARRFTDFAGLAFLASTVPGVISATSFTNEFTEVKAERAYNLRYVSSAVVLFLNLIVTGAACWSHMSQPRAGKRGIVVISALAGLISIIASYRLAVMHYTTTSLESTEPGSLNSTGAKAAFYVLHVLPEWVASAVILGVNIRKTFGTGVAGDWRFRDETESEKQQRLRFRERRKARKEKKEARAAEAAAAAALPEPKPLVTSA